MDQARCDFFSKEHERYAKKKTSSDNKETTEYSDSITEQLKTLSQPNDAKLVAEKRNLANALVKSSISILLEQKVSQLRRDTIYHTASGYSAVSMAATLIAPYPLNQLPACYLGLVSGMYGAGRDSNRDLSTNDFFSCLTDSSFTAFGMLGLTYAGTALGKSFGISEECSQVITTTLLFSVICGKRVVNATLNGMFSLFHRNDPQPAAPEMKIILRTLREQKL